MNKNEFMNKMEAICKYVVKTYLPSGTKYSIYWSSSRDIRVSNPNTIGYDKVVNLTHDIYLCTEFEKIYNILKRRDKDAQADIFRIVDCFDEKDRALIFNIFILCHELGHIKHFTSIDYTYELLVDSILRYRLSNKDIKKFYRYRPAECHADMFGYSIILDVLSKFGYICTHNKIELPSIVEYTNEFVKDFMQKEFNIQVSTFIKNDSIFTKDPKYLCMVSSEDFKIPDIKLLKDFKIPGNNQINTEDILYRAYLYYNKFFSHFMEKNREKCSILSAVDTYSRNKDFNYIHMIGWNHGLSNVICEIIESLCI